MLGWTRSIALVNARVLTPEGVAASVRFGSRVLAVDTPPVAKDVVVDVDGAFVLPGLVNAHDHLELNHYGRLKRRDRYSNASEWIGDLGQALRTDPAIRENMAYSLASRLFIGGLKNLLSGVTTVAHHNPRYREIGRASPVRVVRRYGWAHSLALERAPVGARGEPGGEVRKRFLATPGNAPFIVHAGEGVDETARAELSRLDDMGCLGSNTVVVHGVAVTPTHWSRMLEKGSSLVWCPASNEFLFAQTAPIRALMESAARAADHVCLATDSRLTGARDLLDELAIAARSEIDRAALLRMVTTSPARILRLPEAGRLAVGLPADLIVMPSTAADPAAALIGRPRRDLRLVMIDGQPLVAAAEFQAVFEARKRTAWRLVVDEAERLADAWLVREIGRCPIQEPGLAI